MSAQDIDHLYGLLMENHLDLMYLPSGAIAWLFDRPESQVQAASSFGVLVKRYGKEIVDARLLRSDKNVLVLHTDCGCRVKVYPGGGYGVEDEFYDNVEQLSGYMQQAEFGPQQQMSVEPTAELPDSPDTLGPDYDMPDDIPSMDDLDFDFRKSNMGYADLLTDSEEDLEECDDDPDCDCEKDDKKSKKR